MCLCQAKDVERETSIPAHIAVIHLKPGLLGTEIPAHGMSTPVP